MHIFEICCFTQNFRIIKYRDILLASGDKMMMDTIFHKIKGASDLHQIWYALNALFLNEPYRTTGYSQMSQIEKLAL